MTRIHIFKFKRAFDAAVFVVELDDAVSSNISHDGIFHPTIIVGCAHREKNIMSTAQHDACGACARHDGDIGALSRILQSWPQLLQHTCAIILQNRFECFGTFGVLVFDWLNVVTSARTTISHVNRKKASWNDFVEYARGGT